MAKLGSEKNKKNKNLLKGIIKQTLAKIFKYLLSYAQKVKPKLFNSN